MELQNEHPDKVQDSEITNQEQTLSETTTEESATQSEQSNAETLSTLADFGRAAKSANGKPDVAPAVKEQEEKVEPTPEKPTFAPIRYKADGKEHEVKSEDDLKNLLSAGHNYTRKTQALKEKEKVYNDFEAEIKKDKAFEEGIGLLYNVPQLRKAFLTLAKEFETRGHINPAEVELNALKRAEAARTAEAEEQKLESVSSVIQQHQNQILEEFGGQLPEGYYNRLVALVKGGGANDLLEAHEILKPTVKKVAQQEPAATKQEILKAQGISGRGKTQSTGNTSENSLAAWGAAFRKANAA